MWQQFKSDSPSQTKMTLKEIKEIHDIKPELTTELIDLSAWFSKYFVTKRISILEIMDIALLLQFSTTLATLNL